MTVWTLEGGVEYDGQDVAGVYASPAEAVEAIATSRDALGEVLGKPGFDGVKWSAGWLARCDYIVLSEMRMGETRTERGLLRSFESVGKGHHSWRSVIDGNGWSGTAAELLALVASATFISRGRAVGSSPGS